MTAPMPRVRNPASFDDWLNTIVGILDSAFGLTDDEQFAVTSIVKKLLTALDIPDREIPASLPMPIVQEMYNGYYSQVLDSSIRRPARAVTSADCVTSLEAWVNALENMILTAYPNLDAEEVLLLAKVLHDLLAAIGVPNRAAWFFPSSVVAAHREISETVPDFK